MLLFIGINGFVGKNFLLSYRGDLIGTHIEADFFSAENKQAKFERLDLADYEQVHKMFKNNRIDEVVLAAAVIYAKNKEVFYNVNVAGVANLIKAMDAFGVKRIIYLSTAVLNNQERIWGEYGRSKDLAEKLLMKSGLDYVILRPAEIYGPFAKEGLGKLINLIGKFRVIPLVNGGRNVLTPVHVADVCEAIIACMSKGIYDKNVYVLAGSQKISLRKFIIEAAKKLNRRVFFLAVPIGLFDSFSYFLPLINREQILRAANTVAFDPRIAEARFGFRFRPINFSYLDDQIGKVD